MAKSTRRSWLVALVAAGPLLRVGPWVPSVFAGRFPSAAAQAEPVLDVVGLNPGTPSSIVYAQETVPVSSEEVVRGSPSRAAMSLVFNVGAGFEPAAAILDVLAEKQLRTTFFVMGWWAAQHPDGLKQIADAGHEIASHGHQVFDLTSVSDDAVRADLEAADSAIQAVTGRTTRPLWSASAGYRNARVREIAASLGYRPIYWTVDSGDWTEVASAESVYSRVMAGAENGAIVVCHFDSSHSADATGQVLAALIDDLRSQGYALVTITDLLINSPV